LIECVKALIDFARQLVGFEKLIFGGFGRPNKTNI